MSISFFIGGQTPRTDVWCDDPATYSTGSTNPRCGVQGILFLFSFSLTIRIPSLGRQLINWFIFSFLFPRFWTFVDLLVGRHCVPHVHFRVSQQGTFLSLPLFLSLFLPFIYLYSLFLPLYVALFISLIYLCRLQSWERERSGITCSLGALLLYHTSFLFFFAYRLFFPPSILLISPVLSLYYFYYIFLITNSHSQS